MLLRKSLSVLITFTFICSQMAYADEAGEGNAGPKKIVAKFTDGTVYTFAKTNGEIISCSKDDVQSKVVSCNTKSTSCSTTGQGVGVTQNAEAQMATASTCDAEVKAKSATCEAFTAKALAECQKISAAVKEEVNACIAAGSKLPDSQIAAAKTDQTNSLAANNEPGYEAAVLKETNANTAKTKNIAECKRAAGEAIKEEKSLLASLGLTKKEAIMLGLGALAGLGAMAMIAKKSKDDSSSTATAPTAPETAATTTAADPACQSGDMVCMCKAERQQRPVACDKSCPLMNGKVDSSCLSKKYGDNWQTAYMKPDGSVVNDPNYNGTENIGSVYTPNSGSSSDSSGSNAYRRGSSSFFSGSNSASGEVNNGKSADGTTTARPASASTDSSFSSSGGSSNEFGGGVNPDSPYASGLPSATSASRDPERAQLAAASSNNFSNVSRVYKRYSIELLAP